MSELHGCPFHSGADGVSLAEIPGIIRCADRGRMQQALNQLAEAICHTDDLDEAKGEALTFIAVVTAATLEMGGDRSMHRVQLNAARRLDRLRSNDRVAKVTVEILKEIASALFAPLPNPSQVLVEKALQMINQRYMDKISDEMIAAKVGLSTSHFRHLFRDITGMPFSRYVGGIRLERAKQMLVEEQFLSINEIASACGFTAASHFTRAFTQRFSVSPSSMRRGSLAVQVNRSA